MVKSQLTHTSKAELHSELDLARSARRCNPTKVCVEGFAKVLVPSDIVQAQAGIDTIEIRMVEGIEHLRAELKALVIMHSPVLCYREIKVLCAGSSYGAATKAAKPPYLR